MAKFQAAGNRAGKKIRVLKAPAQKAKRITRHTLRSAFVSGLRAKTGRSDLQIADAPEVASRAIRTVPIEQRAGYPVTRAKGSLDPKDWMSHLGVKIEVDFSRAPWLPDSWGQGVKTTEANSRSTKGSGGYLTTFVAPDGKSFFHRSSSAKYAGMDLTKEVGFNGQVRMAQLQAQQAIQLARSQIKGLSTEGPSAIGVDTDASFFKATLSAAERRHLPSPDDFHFCVVSARRATKLEGVRDIWMVESQLRDAGVTPTWYVDEASLKDYQALGLKAVVGGKLTAARNKALKDASARGKVCVQCSDDISAWEYRHGPNAKERTDDAMNAANAAAQRFIVSPVAAARFVLTKMRTAEGTKPKLGGVYPLGSCARTFCSDAFGRRHFIIGDFFIVDSGSKVRFDEEMRLKEDYDFTCAHIKAHGSVFRCNRLTLNVKHYANVGGACSNRDSKGTEEQRNIAILNAKWPGAFRSNPKRKNEVIMRWRKGQATEDDDDDDEEEASDGADVAKTKPCGVSKAKKLAAKKVSAKQRVMPRQKGKVSAVGVCRGGA